MSEKKPASTVKILLSVAALFIVLNSVLFIAVGLGKKQNESQHPPAAEKPLGTQ